MTYIDNIAESVADVVEITVNDMKSNSRLRKHQMAREILITICRQGKDKISYMRLGNYLNRHHSTIISAYKFARIDSKYNLLYQYLHTQTQRRLDNSQYTKLSDMQSKVIEYTEDKRLRWYIYNYFGFPYSMRKASIASDYRYEALESKDFKKRYEQAIVEVMYVA